MKEELDKFTKAIEGGLPACIEKKNAQCLVGALRTVGIPGMTRGLGHTQEKQYKDIHDVFQKMFDEDIETYAQMYPWKDEGENGKNGEKAAQRLCKLFKTKAGIINAYINTKSKKN